MKYIIGLCECVFPRLDSNVKSTLGVMLSKQMEGYKDNSIAGDDMLIVLCNSNDTALADCRVAITKTMKLFGTTYAFMLPKKLSELLSCVDSIRDGKVMMTKVPCSNEIIGAGEGYDVVSIDLIDKPKVRKGLKAMHSSNPNKATVRSFLNNTSETRCFETHVSSSQYQHRSECYNII